jgi:hypothetical protein
MKPSVRLASQSLLGSFTLNRNRDAGDAARCLD